MSRVLLVTGRNEPSAEHWQSLWAREHPEYEWVPRPDGPLDQTVRVAALQEAISASAEPAVLVAHSAGCLTVARWAWQHTGPVRGALLVAPPYLQQTRRPRTIGAASTPDHGTATPPDETSQNPAPAQNRQPAPGPVPDVPRDRLPFPTFVVASRTDPTSTFEQAADLATAWDARLIDAGDAGHINTASGYGPWPAGAALLAELR